MQYFYDKQIRRYIQQFIRLFSGFTVEMGTNSDGSKIYQTVPVRYGDVSRMAAHIVKENSENVVNATPFISCYVSDMSIAPDRRTHAQYQDKVQVWEKKYDEQENRYLDEVGNTYQVTRYQPVPYDLTMQVDVWTSNTEQKLQLLEQMLVLFNPSLNIHASNNVFDWTSLSYVELINMTWSVRSIPSGVDEIIDVSTLQFNMPINISPPAKVQRQTLIHTILQQINEVDDINLDAFKAGENFSSRYSSYNIVTLENYKMRFLDNTATILSSSGNETDSEGNLITWNNVLTNYGDLRPGISQLRLRQSPNPTDDSQDIIGTLDYHPTDPQKLNVTINEDTLPANTLGTVDAILDTTRSYPGDGEVPMNAPGQRYLILTDTSDHGPWGVKAKANDIIVYNGTKWVVAFSSAGGIGGELVTNTTTNDQYQWTGKHWQNSFEGVYSEGFWRLYI